MSGPTSEADKLPNLKDISEWDSEPRKSELLLCMEGDDDLFWPSIRPGWSDNEAYSVMTIPNQWLGAWAAAAGLSGRPQPSLQKCHISKSARSFFVTFGVLKDQKTCYIPYLLGPSPLFSGPPVLFLPVPNPFHTIYAYFCLFCPSPLSSWSPHHPSHSVFSIYFCLSPCFNSFPFSFSY